MSSTPCRAANYGAQSRSVNPVGPAVDAGVDRIRSPHYFVANQHNVPRSGTKERTMPRTRRKTALSLLTASFLLISLAACGEDDEPEGLGGTDDTPTGTPIVIGADLDTTGPAASYNKQVQE